MPAVPPSSPGTFPVLSVNDTVPINHLTNHVLQVAASGLDIDVSDPKNLLTGNQAALLEKDMTAAANDWMDRIDNPHHAPINILINITNDDINHPRLDGGPAFNVSTYNPTGTGDNPTLESAVEYKLQTGADPTTGVAGDPKLSDGAQADVVINVNSNYLNSVGWLDPNPDAGSDVPPRKVDMVSELMHEFGHGLGIGITSSFDTTTGTFGSGEKTAWESHLDVEKSGTSFTGSNAEKEHGGPVAVTTDTPGENYQHLGNSQSDAADPYTGGPDVMYGVSFDTGEHYEVSDQDVAILQDLGYDTKARVAVPGNYSNPALSHDIAATYFSQHNPSVIEHDIAATSFGHHNNIAAAPADHINPGATTGSTPAWNVIGAGDHSHDGKADVVSLQHSDENVALGNGLGGDAANKGLDVAKGGGDQWATHPPTASFVGDAWGNLISHQTDTSLAGHQLQLQAAHGISFSELPTHLLEAAHTQASIAAGNHDATPESILSSVTHPVSTVDHMLGHFELPTIAHSEFAHLH